MIVDRHEGMNPENEMLMFADRLKNGMVVRITDENPQQKYQWVKISEIRIDDKHDLIVNFIANYDDGTQAIVGSGLNAGWLVKIDSIPLRDEKVIYFGSSEKIPTVQLQDMPFDKAQALISEWAKSRGLRLVKPGKSDIQMVAEVVVDQYEIFDAFIMRDVDYLRSIEKIDLTYLYDGLINYMIGHGITGWRPAPKDVGELAKKYFTSYYSCGDVVTKLFGFNR